MAGRPTLTTEPSMKARLDARMVVASRRRGWAHAPPMAGALAASARSQPGGTAVLMRRLHGKKLNTCPILAAMEKSYRAQANAGRADRAGPVFTKLNPLNTCAINRRPILKAHTRATERHTMDQPTSPDSTPMASRARRRAIVAVLAIAAVGASALAAAR